MHECPVADSGDTVGEGDRCNAGNIGRRAQEICRDSLHGRTERDGNRFRVVDGDFIRLTNKGLDLANIVWEEFI